MLRYPKSPQPKVLIRWQTTPGVSWESIPASDKTKVRDALLSDQGHLCAYCQRRIPAKDEPMKVEHWSAQSGGKDALRWGNLLGVCLGGEYAAKGATLGERHCDTARGDAPLFLHPVEGEGPSPREFLRYTPEGEAYPSHENPALSERVSGDIRVLNLNARRLRRERVVVHDELARRLEKGNWADGALREEYRAATIEPGVPAMPQCEVARYYVRRWARHHGVAL
jgi:uncharacterized protein (TIGR02646 family)